MRGVGGKVTCRDSGTVLWPPTGPQEKCSGIHFCYSINFKSATLINSFGEGGFEPPTSCSQSRRNSHYPTLRGNYKNNITVISFLFNRHTCDESVFIDILPLKSERYILSAGFCLNVQMRHRDAHINVPHVGDHFFHNAFGAS